MVAAVRQLSETTLPFAKVLERQLPTEHLRHGGTLAIRVALAHVVPLLKCVPHALGRHPPKVARMRVIL